MNMGEKFNIGEGTAALLLCARCKTPVKAGINHECKEIEKNEDSNQKQNEDPIPPR